VSNAAAMTLSFDATVAAAVRRGLSSRPKSLPPYLLYDARGSELYEQITDLPEYYLTRAERGILQASAGDIVARASAGARGPLGVIELGAGSASKTELVLRAVLERQTRCVYVPVDVSRAAIEGAKSRLAVELPRVAVRPLVMTHDLATQALRAVGGPQLVLFIGSSIGNFEDAEAAAILGGLRDALGAGASLLLGTDLRKSARVLLPAYDDAAGVTAAFDKNLLVRMNREFGARFDLDRFRHVARWNERGSRVEMHLESTIAQEVALEALGLRVPFERGETIHTESSIKYDLAHVDRLLSRGGFARETTYFDDARTFAVHLARAGATPTQPTEPKPGRRRSR
jgi:L-histidine N-alpha-methyltransferase